MGETKQDLQAKAAGLTVALGSAWVARELISRLWQKGLGHTPPKPEDPGDARWGEIAAAAALTGAVVALARVAATRGAARWIK